MTEYQKLLEAVADYYGAGSDQWTTIATSSNITSQEWATILRQTPNVDVITNNAGDIVSYTVKDTFGTAADTITGAVNSNTQVATLTDAANINIPANTIVDGQGTVIASSGMKTVSSGTTVGTVVKNVATGVAAVAAGVRLGVMIDTLVYNVNPDFWDENGMGTLNPQTWDSICSTEGGKAVFNFVFGINKTTGETQAYMDQRALAYIAQYMVDQNCFGSGSGEVTIDDTTGLNMNNIPTNTILLAEPSNMFHLQIGQYDNIWSTEASRCAAFLTHGRIYCLAASETPFVSTRTVSSGSVYTYNSSQVTKKDKTFYIFSDGYSISTKPELQNIYNDWYNTAQDSAELATLGYILLYGTYSGGSGDVDGITPQSGATLPTGITPQMPIDDVITQLQTLYPDMFNDAIYNDVVQDDGTTKRYIYVPVPMPDTVPVDEITGKLKPTGGTDLSQNDSVIDEDSPDDLIDTLLKILTSPEPYNPTGTGDPPVETDYPDTGNGNTPAVIIPTGSASALYSVYNPSQSQLNSLGAWLWSSNFVDQLLKLFNDPMQAIIGLHKIFATPPTSGTGTIKVGYLDSGVGSNLVSAQYTEIDCGSVDLKEYFGNVLDYTHTDVYIYLPFVGIVPLNVSDVMRSKIEVKYKVDVLTGACLASVNVFRDNNAGGQLYVYAGNCAVQYPLSSGSYMGIVAGVLGIAGSVAGTMLSGGALLPMALGAGASALNSAKTKVEHGGALSGNSGAMGIKKPYLIIRRPQTKIADNFNVLDGVAENVYGVLGSYTGFTRVKYIHLENINATDEELSEIETILKSGVMI